MITAWCEKCKLHYDPRGGDCPYCDLFVHLEECQCEHCVAERDYELMARMRRR